MRLPVWSLLLLSSCSLDTMGAGGAYDGSVGPEDVAVDSPVAESSTDARVDAALDSMVDGPVPPTDAPVHADVADALKDAFEDAVVLADAHVDSPVDASDAGTEAGLEAGLEAGPDAGPDAATDATIDVTLDAGPAIVIESNGGSYTIATPGHPAECSKNSNQSASFALTNHRAESVRVLWVKYNCDEQEYAQVAPNAAMSMNTFVTHWWRIRSVSTGNVIAEFVLDAPGQYSITLPGS
jgi:hypothetical protein